MDPDVDNVEPSVSCNECNAACCRLTVCLMPSDHVPERLIHRDILGKQTLIKGEDGWCAAVDRKTSRCTIYEQRPAICRKYAMGGPGCRDARNKWFDGHVFPTPVMLIAH